MKLAKRLIPLIFVLPLFSCEELQQRVSFVETRTKNAVQITRREYTRGPLEVDREMFAKYLFNDPDNKYINHEYYPILEIGVRFPLDYKKKAVQYLDDKCNQPGTQIVDAYWDGEKWIQRSVENEEVFLRYDKEFLEFKKLLEVDERVNKH